MNTMIAIAFPLSFLIFLILNHHCAILTFFPIKSQLLITHAKLIKLIHLNYPTSITEVSTYCKLIQQLFSKSEEQAIAHEDEQGLS